MNPKNNNRMLVYEPYKIIIECWYMNPTKYNNNNSISI